MHNFTHAQSMIELFSRYIPTRVIYVAAKLGLADSIGAEGAAGFRLQSSVATESEVSVLEAFAVAHEHSGKPWESRTSGI